MISADRRFRDCDGAFGGAIGLDEAVGQLIDLGVAGT
jgi:hypothetical protein